jgi:hypothetical protein
MVLQSFLCDLRKLPQFIDGKITYLRDNWVHLQQQVTAPALALV